MNGLEVERKWLVSDAGTLPAEVLALSADEIRQGYLVVAPDGSEARVRNRAGRCTLTVKSGQGLIRREVETAISAEQFEQLWPATEGARIEKWRRLTAGEAGLTIEVDVYMGALAGLVVAEVEFDDPRDAESFVAPYWFGTEVTADDRYKNRNLAVNGRPA